jgi:hypothetical protein
VYVGTIIEQSLITRTVLDHVHIINTLTVDVPHAVDGQPAQWPFTEFRTDQPDIVAERLANDLRPGPWYVDFHNDIEVFVVSGTTSATPTGFTPLASMPGRLVCPNHNSTGADPTENCCPRNRAAVARP